MGQILRPQGSRFPASFSPPPFRKCSGFVPVSPAPEAAHFTAGELALCGVGTTDHEGRKWSWPVAVRELRLGEVGNVDELLEAGGEVPPGARMRLFTPSTPRAR